MSDPRKPKGPPPLRLKDGPELVRVVEDDAPDTQRGVAPPVVENSNRFKVHNGRGPSYLEIAAAISTTQTQLSAIAVTQGTILDVQRKLAQQQDGLGRTVNVRLDLFHEELALLRQTVTGDHAPRLDKVETTLGQKAARGGGALALALVALPMLADALPRYAHFINTILGVLQ